jgi:PAS domain S-box-containing protein
MRLEHEPVAQEPLRPLSDAGPSDDVVWALVDAAPDGIIMADERGQIMLVNRQTEGLFGYDRADLLGRSVDDLLPERLRQVHRAHRTRYRAEPRTRSMGAGLSLFGRRRDGTEFPVEISLSPLTTDDGLRVIAVVRDITQRLEAEAAAREVQETLDAARDAVLIFDAETLHFTYVNEGALEQVGYTRDELLNMTMLHIAPEFSETSLRELLGPLERGEISSTIFTTVHRRRDGSDIPVEILLQAIRGDDGRPRRYVKIVRDITERLAAEERLQRAEQHLRVVEDRERIARDLHDIVIQKLFASGMTLQAVTSRMTDEAQSRRLSEVIDDLDSTIREIRSVIFSLQTDLETSSGVRAQILRVIAEERPVLGFEPRVKFEGPLEAVSDAVAQELLASLREALSNVGRHASASAVEVIIECDHDVRLRVLDDGAGIPVARTSGNGLRNLEERAVRLGGSCRVVARPDGGTAVEWQVPNAR